MHLCLDVPRTQVEHEEALKGDATVLDPAREDDAGEYHYTDGNDQGAGELAQVVTDIEDGREGNQCANQDGEKQRQAVTV